jgi:hypothetical protein
MTAKSKGFDLGSIDTIAACNKPFDVEIIHPVTQDKTGVIFRVVGKDSDVYRGKIKAIANENLTRDALMARRGKQDIPNIDKMEARNIDALVAATVGWENVELDGEVLEFSAANARKVYTRILPVREQVLEAINDLENFMPG